MTLILSVANRAYVLQVADRLVTQRRGTCHGRPRFQPLDPLANKCVIYAATDALVSISYTGAAFIEGKPTDVWLAQALDADIAAGPPSVFRIGRGSERRITLGAAVNRVATKLAQDLRAMPPPRRASGVTLQLVGWQWRRRRRNVEMPIVWHITNDGSGTETAVHRLPRYWGWERNLFHIAAAGDRRSDPRARVQQRLEGRTELCAEVVEQVLVETIREASMSPSSGGSIGADCIAVWVRLSDGNVRVRYLPASPDHAAYDVYTPWVVMPTVGSWAPSVLSGAPPTLHLGGLDILFERASPSAPGLPVSATHLRRPPEP